jgi:hypothetical protein
MRYDFLVTGTCTNKAKGKSGDFSLCVMSDTSENAVKEAVKDLQNAGYSDVFVSKVSVSRLVSDVA